MNLLRRATLFLCVAAWLPGIGMGADDPAQKAANRADAYYYYSMGHVYAEQATLYNNRAELLSRAIDFYKQAIKADPSAAMISDELASLYFRAGRYKEAVADLEDRLKKDPNAVDARRVLGGIYLRLIGGQGQGPANQEYLKQALEQFQKVVEIDPKDTDSWLLLGRLYKASGDSVAAEKAYKKALELNPDDEEGVTGLAMVYSGLGDNKRALEMLKQVADRNPSLRTLTTLVDAYESIHDYASAADVLKRASELDPTNPDLKRGMAQDLMMAGKLEEALKTYSALAEEDPSDGESFLRMSQIYRQMNNFTKAREALEKAKQAEPDNFEILYSEVSLLEAQGRSAEAIAIMRKLVDSTEKRSYSPSERANRVTLLGRLGELYRSNEQYSQAVDTFRKMEQSDPGAGPRASAQVVETYRQAKEYDRALQEAEAANKKYPDERMVALTRADLLAELGKGDEAAAEVKKLFKGDDDRDSWFALAQVYEKAKNYREMGRSLDSVEKLVATNDEKVNVYFMRGAMYERMKQFDPAEKEFRKALELDPDNSSVMNYLGYMLADRGVRLEDAHGLISRAVERDPYNGAYLDSLGWVLFRMGKLDDAEMYLRRALERTSRDPTVHDHLADVLARQGKLKEAITEWEVSLKQWDLSSPSEKDTDEVAKITKKLEGARVRLAQESSGPPRTP